MTHWKKNLFILSSAQFITMMGMSFFLPFIPLYLAELGVSDPASTARWSGVLFGSGFLVISLVAPIWGFMADRMGRKLMVVRATATAALILFLTAIVHTPYQLLVLRLLHGCFSGFACSSIALIAAESPASSMGFGMGLFQSSLTAGFIIGPFLGGVLQDYFGIRRTILGGGVILLAATVMVLLLVKEKNKPQKHELKGGPLSNIKYMMKDPILLPAASIQFFSNLEIMLVQPLLALIVMSLSHTATHFIGTMSGLVISASGFSMMIGAPFWGRMSDRMGQKKILILCLIASGLLFIPQGMAQNVTQLFFARLMFGFFAAGIAPSLQAAIAHHAPAGRRAGVLGVAFSITMFGNAIGPFVGGFLASSIGLQIPFFCVAVLLIGTGFLSRYWKIALPKAGYPALGTVE